MRQLRRAIKIIDEIAARHKLKPPFAMMFVGQDGRFDNGRCDLLIDARAFQAFQMRLAGILDTKSDDMRKFVIRFLSSVDRTVGTSAEKWDEEWIN